MQEVGQLSDLVAKYGVVPLLLLAIAFLVREWRASQRECRRWQKLGLSALTEADKSVGLAEFYRGAE